MKTLLLLGLIILSGCTQSKICDYQDNCNSITRITGSPICCSEIGLKKLITYDFESRIKLCPEGTKISNVQCECAKNTTIPCMMACFTCEVKQ